MFALPKQNCLQKAFQQEKLFAEKRMIFKGEAPQTDQHIQALMKSENVAAQREFMERSADLTDKTLEAQNKLAEDILNAFDKTGEFANSLNTKIPNLQSLRNYLDGNKTSVDLGGRPKELYPNQQEALLLHTEKLTAGLEVQNEIVQIRDELTDYDLASLLMSDKLSGPTKIMLAGLEYKDGRIKNTIPGTNVESSIKPNRATLEKFKNAKTKEEVYYNFYEKLAEVGFKGKEYDARNQNVKELISFYNQNYADLAQKNVDLRDKIAALAAEQKGLDAAAEKEKPLTLQSASEGLKAKLPQFKISAKFQRSSDLLNAEARDTQDRPELPSYSINTPTASFVVSEKEGKLYLLQMNPEGKGDKLISTLTKASDLDAAAQQIIAIDEANIDKNLYRAESRSEIKVDANGVPEIPDLTINIAIADQKTADIVSSAVDSPEEWAKIYKQLTYRTSYEDIMERVGVEANQTAEKMAIILNEGAFDDEADFSDFLTAIEFKDASGSVMDGDEFRDEFVKLLRMRGAAMPENEKARLEKMETVYFAGQELLSLLSRETLQEVNAMSLSEKYRGALNNLRATNEEGSPYFNFDQLSDNTLAGQESLDSSALAIGLNQASIAQFEKAYNSASGENGNIQEDKILRTLLRTHSLDDLFAGGHIQKNEKQPNRLVITSLPEAYKAEPALKKPFDKPVVYNVDQRLKNAFKHINSDVMTDDNSWSNVDAAEDDRKAKEGLKETFSGSYHQILSELTNSLQQVVDRETVTAAQNARGLETGDGANRMYSAERIALMIMGEEKITSRGKEFQIYKIENGVRVVNKQDLLRFLNHLTKNTVVIQDTKLDSTQAKAVEKGFIEFMEGEKMRQDLAHEARAQKVVSQMPADSWTNIGSQLRAVDYKGNLGELKSAFVAGLVLSFKKGEGITPGLTIIPLGDDCFVSMDAVSPDGGIRVGGGKEIVVFRGDSNEGRVIVGARGTSNGTIEALTGYKHVWEDLNSNYDAYALAGLHYKIGRDNGVALAIGGGVQHNFDRAKGREFDKLVDKMPGLEEILDKTTGAERAEAVRKHPHFKEASENLDDADVLALFNLFMEDLSAKAVGEAIPVVTEFGAGLMIGASDEEGIYGGAYMGVKILVGGRVVHFLKRGERERIARENQQINIDEQIAKAQIDGTLEWTQGNFILDDRGRLRMEQGSDSAEINETSFEKVRSALAAHDIDVTKTQYQGKEALAIAVNDREYRNLQIYRDPKSTDIETVLDNGRVLLVGNPDHLTVTRTRLSHVVADAQGEAAVDEMITFSSVKGSPDLSAVQKGSSHLIESRWNDGQPLAFQEKAGAKYLGKKVDASQLESFSDEIHGVNKEEYQKIRDIINKNKFSREADETSRDDWAFTVEDLYKKFEADFKAGNPDITDIPKMVAKVNAELNRTNSPEKHTNATEIAEMVQIFQHLYFVDVWKSGGKEAVKAAMTKHNKYLGEKVFVPAFTETINKLGLAKGPEAQTKAQAMFDQLISLHADEFARILDNNDGDPKNIQMVNNLPQDMVYSIGTTVRDTKEGRLTNALLADSSMQVNGYDKMGLITLENVEKNTELYKVLLELQNPTLDNTDLQTTITTLQSPFMQRLLNVPQIGAELGVDSFETIHRLAKNENPESQVEDYANVQFQLKQLETIAKTLRDNGVVTLKDGTKLQYTTEVKTGLYGKCTNFSILSRGALKITTKDKTVYIAEGNENVIPDSEYNAAGLELGFGINITPPDEKPKAPTNPKDARTSTGNNVNLDGRR